MSRGLLVLLLPLLMASTAVGGECFQWKGVPPAARVVPSTGDSGDQGAVAQPWVTVQVENDEWCVDAGAAGAPALPKRTVLFAVPDRQRVADVSFEAEWETLAEGVRVIPVAEPVRVGEESAAPAPDAAIYGGAAPWPATPVAPREVETMCGVRVLPVTVAPFRWNPATGLLERARKLAVTVAFEADAAARSRLLAPGLAESVKAAVVNPAAVGAAAVVGAVDRTSMTSRTSRTLTTAPSLTTARSSRSASVSSPLAADSPLVDYLLISPPDFVADWEWYVTQRKAVHSNVVFKVVNTADIYRDYPFPTDAQRNAAESIHAYLRANRETMKFSYVVLGGAWFDAQDRKKANPRFYGGEVMSLSNCVPGVYGYPRENWRDIPSDMFYACLDMKDNQKYPWDANADGVYIDQNDCSKNDLRPDVCVTRLTLNPYRPNGWTAYNRHTLVTNYVAKLARGEAKGFRGHFRYGLSPDSTGSRRLRANGDRMNYDELEFYDNMYNMFDPLHADQIEDNEVEPRRRIKDQFAKWRPVLEAKGMMSYTWTKGFANLSAATADYYAADRDYGFVYSHGWAQGATHFQAGQFGTCKGLTILNGSNGPCDTGYPDYYVTMNGIPTLQYNLGDSGVSNPDGGALASINNTRWGWAGGSHTGLDFDSSMSYFMLNRSLVGFNQLYLDVGHAWFKGVSDYASFGFTQGGGTHTWTLTEQICYGDPLVRLPAPEDRWWTGGATGVWDSVTANWSNALAAATTYYAASNVYFTAATDLVVTVTEPVGALKVAATMDEGSTLAFLGSNGCLRVMRELAVTGGDLYLDVPGGVGHDGIVFSRAEGQARDGELTFAGTNVFYLAKLAGASRVNLRGGGVTLDADKFPTDTQPLAFDGPGVNYLPNPNILRSRQADGLRRFGPLAMTNTYVKLATADGFGRSNPLTHTLVSSKLEIAANAYYQWKSCYQKDGYAEKLSATFDVVGSSEVTSSKGGLWTVSATTTFNLATNATLSLSAATKDCGGKIVINGGGAASVKTSDSLCGTVEVGPGVTLVLDELPLASVTSLTIADGAKVVVPEAKSGYWQILPVSSRLTCGADVKFYTQENQVEPLDGQPSPTGAFFKKGALYEWQSTDTHWTSTLAHQHPKILFGDLPSILYPLSSILCHTVTVDLAVAPSFVSFANVTTAYTFVSAPAKNASVTFTSVIFNGSTRFDLPVSATEYAEILGGTNGFKRLVSPKLTVGAGGALALTGSHWTKIVLEEGAALKALPGEYLDWNFETTLERHGTTPTAIDVSALALDDTPQVLVSGTGHAWTVADLANYTLVGQFAEFRIVDGKLCVVKGDGLKSPYALDVVGETNWNCRAWRAANGAFATNWSASVLDVAGDIRVTATGETARLTLDCDAVGATLALITATNTTLTLTEGETAASTVDAASRRVTVDTIDLTDAQGTTVLDLETGAANVTGPTNDAAVCALRRPGRGTVTLAAGQLTFDAPGVWTLAAGAQGHARVVLPPTNRVVTLVKLAAGFEYPCGGFDMTVVDTNGVSRTDCTVTKVGDTLVAVPSVLDVSDVDFDELVKNAVAGAPYSHWLVQGSVDGQVAITNLPSRFTGGTNVTVETIGAYGIRLVVTAPDVRLGSVSINFAGGRNGETNAAGSRVSDNETYCNTFHGVQPVAGTNWNDVAAANGNYVAKRVVCRDGTVETNAAVGVKLTNVKNPYSTGSAVGDQILYGYLDDGSSPVVELSGIPFARYRVIAYRATDNGGTVFSSCRIGTSAADAKAYYGSSARGSTAVVTLAGDANMGWGDTNVRNKLIEGVNYVVSGVLTGGRAYVASPKHTGRACLTALQVIEVAGEVAPEEPVVDTTLREVKATAADGEWNWQALAWTDTNGQAVASVDWSEIRRATLTGTSNAVVTLDVPSYAGVVTLAGGAEVAAHAVPAFTLGTGSVGRVEVRLVAAPTASATLLKTEAAFHPTNAAVVVALRDQFGAVMLAPVAVQWETGRYWMNVQNLDAPTWRHTFTGTVTDPNYNSTGLPETNDPAQFEKCREDGQALINWYRGSTKSSLMEPFPSNWTLNIVARTPNNRNGVLFAFGYGGYSPKGFAFVSDGTDRAALVVWRNWNEYHRLSSGVPLATTQFHAYTITYDGATLKLYVDGELADSCVDTEGFAYMNGTLIDKIGWFQFWGVCSGRYPASLTGANGGAIDDWSFYKDTCLTPESVKALAARFPPWPQTTEATVYEQEVAWTALQWTPEVESWASVKAAAIEAGAEGASVFCDEPAFSNKLVLADGATLIATNTVGFSLAPYPVGAMTFRLDDVTESRRLVNTTSDYACDDASFSITVTNTTGAMPPEPWFVTRYTDGWYWLRLQDIARPHASLDFNGALTTGLADTTQPTLKDTDNAQYTAARGNAKGALTGRNPYLDPALGLFGTWTCHVVARMPSTANGIVFAYGNKTQGLALYAPSNGTVAVGYWYGSAKRGDFVTAVVTNAQVQYHAYALTHTGSRLALWVDGEKRGEASASGYPNNGNAQFFSVHGGTPSGFANGQTGAIDDWRFFGECLGPKAIEMLAEEFQPWPENIVNYAAEVTNSTVWAAGTGSGLRVTGTTANWENGPNNLISLTVATNATLTFDTATTASVLRVTSAASNALTLAATTGDLAIAELALTAGADVLCAGEFAGIAYAVPAAAKLTLAEGLAWKSGDAVAAGGWVCFEGARTFTAPPITTTGAIVSYRSATVKRASANEFTTLRVREGDAVTYDANGGTLFNILDVTGGELTLQNGSNVSVLYFGGLASSPISSAIRVSGGRLTVKVAQGTGTNNKTCGLLVGTTASSSYIPAVAVTGGEMTCDGGRLTLWEKSTLAVSGGRLVAQGLGKGGGGASSVTLSDAGVIELGAGAIGRSGGGSLTVTLKGGTLRAYETLTNSWPLTLAGDATLAAKVGQRLAVSGTVSGTGTLTCSGEVAFVRSDFTGVVTNGWLDLVGTRTNGVFEVLSGAASLAVTNVALNGEALEADEWTRTGGAYTVTPHWRFGVVADADALKKPLKVSRAWLADHGFTPEGLAADPSKKGANGYAVWESYLLGLNPTNAAAVLKAIVAFEAGKLKVSAKGIDGGKTRGVRVRYALESAEHPSGPYETHRAAQDGEHFTDLDSTSTSRFYRVNLQWHWK